MAKLRPKHFKITLKMPNLGRKYPKRQAVTSLTSSVANWNFQKMSNLGFQNARKCQKLSAFLSITH